MAATRTTFPARLLVVVDRDYVGDDDRWLALIAEVARAAVGHPIAIQVRAKSTPSRSSTCSSRARDAVPYDVTLLLNGDAEVAERLGYTGVHWPETAVPSTGARDGLALHSAAVHSIEAIRRAEAAGADFVVFGAVYAPGSKPGEGVGVAALEAAVRATQLPVVAIGGIQPEQIGECIRAGASGIAVVSGILGAQDVHAAIERYVHAIAVAEGTPA